MVNELFNWILQIPQTIASFGSWLMSPIYDPYIKLSPLALLGIGGVSTIIIIIGVHVVKLFI